MRLHLTERSVYTVIGLMSGTSLDGIDAAVVRLKGNGTATEAELVSFYFAAYDHGLRDRLRELCSRSGAVHEICTMNAYLGKQFAEAAIEAAAQAGLDMQEIDFISSHGHTIWHQPQQEAQEPFSIPSTLQIGDLSVIAKITGRPVVGDFRPADMALGGQGAPLTPYADYIFLGHPTKGRIAQNIGGIANCTVLPAGAAPGAVTAFDSGPGNMVIDHAVYRLSGGQYRYDPNGEWAGRGSVHQELLQLMLEHPYFSKPPVKSTGREQFGSEYTDYWIEEAQRYGLSSHDIIATLTALTVRSIADAYREYIFKHHRIHEVVVSGGGTHNRTMMSMLAAELPEQQVLTSDQLGISSDAREAIAFALLGHSFIHQSPNNLPAVTGASSSTIMGKLALP